MQVFQIEALILTQRSLELCIEVKRLNAVTLLS